MTTEQIKQLSTRHLHRPDQSGRRLSRESLDISVPLDAETTARLPKTVLETLGTGYGLDALWVVNTKTGEKYKLPGRYDITKAHGRSAEAVGNDLEDARTHGFYRGCNALRGWNVAGEKGIFNTGLAARTTPVHGLFRAVNRGSGDTKGIGWKSDTSPGFMMAYAGRGYANGFKIKGAYDHYIVAPQVTDSKEVLLDLESLITLAKSNGDIATATDAQGLDWLYRHLSPLAWETIEVNRDVIAAMSLTIKDVERVLDSIYNRGRDHLGVRINDPILMKWLISLIELGAAIRTKRFSRNIDQNDDHFNDAGPHEKYKRVKFKAPGKTATTWSKGVVNDFFFNINDEWVIAPYYLINQLNFYDFVDDEREHEMRDISRKDAIETLHYIMEMMDYEKGLALGSDATLPMLVFDKYKEGVLKSFKPSEYTSVEATVAANLLGYATVRDADNGIKSTTAGNVGYFSTLPKIHGMLLGSDKAEFLDRIAEAGEQTMTVTNVDGFKNGMQLASSFDYQTTLGRTKAGHADLDYRVYTGGWMRGISRNVPFSTTVTNDGTSVILKSDNKLLNVLWFPLLGWTQYHQNCSTMGMLPRNMNGAYFNRSLGEDPVPFCASSQDHKALYPDGDDQYSDESYWKPGRDNYTMMLLRGTNDLYRTWMDRADTIATEGVTVPSMGAVNLVAEMSYDTPNAIVARNFGTLRRLYQKAGIGNGVVSTDTSFDFMFAGDDIHGVSAWKGETPFKLVDRHLDDAEAHPRNGSLDLIPHMYVSKVLPESWTDVFQLRDWMMFFTSLASEPIMDAYTRTVKNSTWQNSGHINSRLVVYVKETELDGRVRDLTATPIIGSYYLTDATTKVAEYDHIVNEAELITMFPETVAEAVDYEMYLLGMGRIRNETLRAGITDAIHMSSKLPTDVAEGDFVPGREHARRWIDESLHPDVAAMTYDELFSDTTILDVNPGNCLAFLKFNRSKRSEADGSMRSDPNIGSLSEIKKSDGIADNTDLGAGVENVLTNSGLVYWNHAMGEYIDMAREGLEYQRASPLFTIFDKDILDKDESMFRVLLAPLGLTTLGPLTFVGTMTATGEAQASQTITGDARLEVVSMTSGAGSSAMDAADPDPEDEDAGDENPSLSIAEKPNIE
jgi:hypothetical protein